MQRLRWFFSIAILVGICVLNYFYTEIELLYRVVGSLLAICVSILIVWSTQLGVSVRKLFKGSRRELKKVVWPTRSELVQTTIVVLVAVLVIGILLWSLDSLFSWSISLLIG